MKKSIIRIAFIALFAVASASCTAQRNGSTNPESQSSSKLGNLLSGLGKTVGNMANTDNFELTKLEGAWKYSEPSVAFKSDDALKKIGGAAVATQIEQKIAPYYTKVGLNNSTLTFDKDANFELKFGKITLHGTVTRDGDNLVFNFKSQRGTNLGKLNSVTTLGLNQLNVCFDAQKFVNIISGISTLSGSSTLSSVTNVLKSYKGIYIGFRMKK